MGDQLKKFMKYLIKKRKTVTLKSVKAIYIYILYS